ncbi:aryl hydrocarbon receptor 1a [Salminus brasiliensis]|uniref:aryl hydrocarbon receptor 1a n=1 Tax=Salminus brasiliensis TaxID=930266 RepID=UPI003B83580E
MSTGNVYASRKRRKPCQKSTKPSAANATKSNPSKRHRDRLNGELDQLASLLPFHQDVVSKLDKLTVLRLSVGYLRAKGHFTAVLNSRKSSQSANSGAKVQVQELPEGELLLQVLSGFVLVVTAGGTVFYASSSVQDYLGFHQSDIVHQSVFELIHTEDRDEFRRQLHWALNPTDSTDVGQLVRATQDLQLPLTYYEPEQLPPENSAFLERNFICRLRCLLDNSSGFLAMNFQGRLKFLHGQKERTAEGKLLPSQLALFALACPVQPPSILEIRTKNFMFRTKHKLDFTPLACDAKGKIVLGYTEEELCASGSGYQFIHAADMLLCAKNHIRMMKTGESGLTVFRLLTKRSSWIWVQSNARLVYKNGRPEFIIASQRVLTEEEGVENLKKRSLMLPFSFTTGEAVLYDYSLPESLSGFIQGADTASPGNSNQPSPSAGLLGSMRKQDKSLYVCPVGSNEPQGCPQEPDEVELGGIFSSNFQESVLSLSENSLFKPDPAVDSAGRESGCELLSFMGSLGINLEDLQILQQDKLFLSGGFDERGALEDLTDEVLTYVQESLRRKADCMLSGSGVPANSGLLSSAPQTCGHPPTTFKTQSQQEHFPLLEPSEPKLELFSHRQSNLQPQGDLYPKPSPPCPESYELSQVALQEQRLQSLTDGQHGPQAYPAGHSCLQNPEQLYHRLKHMQGSSEGTAGQQLPPVLQPGLQQPGRFYVEATPLGLEVPYRNQVNTMSTHCNKDFPCSYIPVGDSRVEEFSTQDLDDLLSSLDGVGQREEWCPWKPAGEL